MTAGSTKKIYGNSEVTGTQVIGTDPGGTELLRVGGSARINGALYYKVRNITSSGGTTNLDQYDTKISVKGTNTHTVVMPSCETGRLIMIRNHSTQLLTVSRSGSDTLDGNVSITLAGNVSYTWIGNGTTWEVQS
jgi:hypothetical protein